MQRTGYKQKTRWVVLPAELVKGKTLAKKKLGLRALRSAVSRAWRGAGAVEEIRAQRKR